MDEQLLLFVNGLRAPWLDAIFAPLSSYGLYAFPILMMIALVRGWRAELRSVLDGWLAWFLATFIVETIVKPIVARPRPTAIERVRDLLEVLGKVPPVSSYAFPSGTSGAAFAGATWIALRWGWKPGAPALALATVISISRVYVGIHWPSDMLGGAIIGALVAFGLDRLSRPTESA